MNPYIMKLKTYLDENPLDYSHSEVNSLLEVLYLFYTENNPVDRSVVKQHFSNLDWIFAELPLDKSDQLFGAICDLYAECERLAFVSAIQIGACLVKELLG